MQHDPAVFGDPSPCPMAVSPVRRLLLTVEYDGTDYAGWQRQLNGPGVQEALEKALERVTGQKTPVVGASRTDAGVHAEGQRVHLDTTSAIPDEKLPFALNTVLPRDIRVLSALAVPQSVHARFSASGKAYSYRFFNRRHASALHRRQSAHVPLPLDPDAMHRAAKSLLGRHDFKAFAASGASFKTSEREIQAVELLKNGDEIVFTVEGNAFLYNMVRIIAGTLIEIGLGRLDEGAFERAIQSGDRLDLGPTAPACGLCLKWVRYPFELLEE